MALDIYSEFGPALYKKHSLENATLNVTPIVTTHNGYDGEIRELKLFVRSNDPDEYCTEISISPDNVPSGWIVKLAVGSLQPTAADWEGINSNNTISFSDIGSSGNGIAVSGNTSQYLSFWYYIKIPADTEVQTNDDILLLLSYVVKAFGDSIV